MKFTESMLKLYAAPLSDTENTMCKRAIEAIRDALKDLGYSDNQKEISLLESDTYSYSVSMQTKDSKKQIHIFIQGSYANNTCVKGKSDVDIAIVREDVQESAFGSAFNLFSRNYQDDAKLFKDIIQIILQKHFPTHVHRHNKSIKVDGNTYRKHADTVPCYSMHYYQSDQRNFQDYEEGIVIYADDGTVTRNFPKQHIVNGKKKNLATKHYYKKMVRIMKKMRYLMSEHSYPCADKVSSFGLESLLWNIPDSIFMNYDIYRFKFGNIVDYLYNNKVYLSTYKEANGIKKLCHNQTDVENYKEFIVKLKEFYQYDIWE